MRSIVLSIDLLHTVGSRRVYLINKWYTLSPSTICPYNFPSVRVFVVFFLVKNSFPHPHEGQTKKQTLLRGMECFCHSTMRVSPDRKHYANERQFLKTVGDEWRQLLGHSSLSVANECIFRHSMGVCVMIAQSFVNCVYVCIMYIRAVMIANNINLLLVRSSVDFQSTAITTAVQMQTVAAAK